MVKFMLISKHFAVRPGSQYDAGAMSIMNTMSIADQNDIQNFDNLIGWTLETLHYENTWKQFISCEHMYITTITILYCWRTYMYHNKYMCKLGNFLQ